MGYFNYFIKCIIRNITYKLCKPKILLSILLVFFLCFFVFRNYGYCAGFPPNSSAEGQYTLISPTNDFVDPNGNFAGTIQTDNAFLTVKEIQEEIQRAFIAKMYAIYSKDNTTAIQYAQTMLNQLYNNTPADNIGIYIQMAGAASQYRINYYKHKELSTAIGMGAYSYNNYMISNVPYQHAICPRDVIDNDGHIVFSNPASEIDIPVPMIGVFVPEFITMFKDFGLINSFENDMLYVLENQNELINEQNYLQEQQNQQQKEQNDFLKQETTDSDVSIDSFNSVDSNDITSSGLTGIFNTIYNSITSWSSKDISLPVPFTNKTINIQANYTQNMLIRVGGGFLINIISTIYYFIVARFIIYSVSI